MEFMKLLMGSAKNLLGKKSTQDILKYLANVTLNYASNKFGVNQYKYDPMDMKNMVYHHNINNDNKIDINELEKAMSIFSIERFMKELNEKNDNSESNMNNFIYDLAKLCNDGKLIETYNTMNTNNHILSRFDSDTLETSSIVDNYEISSGGIYVPDRNIITITSEGNELANAKNDYLEKRLELGDNVKQDLLLNLIKDYYMRIGYDKVLEYFK